jgi:hypothetical protein
MGSEILIAVSQYLKYQLSFTSVQGVNRHVLLPKYQAWTNTVYVSGTFLHKCDRLVCVMLSLLPGMTHAAILSNMAY